MLAASRPGGSKRGWEEGTKTTDKLLPWPACRVGAVLLLFICCCCWQWCPCTCRGDKRKRTRQVTSVSPLLREGTRASTRHWWDDPPAHGARICDASPGQWPRCEQGGQGMRTLVGVVVRRGLCPCACVMRGVVAAASPSVFPQTRGRMCHQEGGHPHSWTPGFSLLHVAQADSRRVPKGGTEGERVLMLMLLLLLLVTANADGRLPSSTRQNCSTRQPSTAARTHTHTARVLVCTHGAGPSKGHA